MSEFEVLSGDRILGEVENIAPGLNGDFSLTLEAGDYTTKCPGGSERDEGKLVVTGTADTKLSAEGQAAVEQYLVAKKDGDPIIPVEAHIRLAAPDQNDGVRLLRRGFSFTDGIDPVTNQLDAGPFFIAYQRDPRTGFIPVQQNLATDALNEYIRHDSTATFACPPGVGGSGVVGETLFD